MFLFVGKKTPQTLRLSKSNPSFYQLSHFPSLSALFVECLQFIALWKSAASNYLERNFSMLLFCFHTNGGGDHHYHITGRDE